MLRKLISGIAAFAVAVSVVPTLSGCSRSEWYERTVYSMDTVVTMKLGSDGLGKDSADDIFDNLEEQLRSYEKALSAHDKDSEIYAFNTSDSGIAVSADTVRVVSAALELAEVSGGRYDPTSASLINLWDIAHGDGIVPESASIEKALSLVDYRLITVEGNSIRKASPETGLDLGSIGKGYVLDRLISSLNGTAVKRALISVGGNVGIYGDRSDGEKWNIAMNSPYGDGKVIGKFEISEGFISVSGDYERYFEADGVRYHHIIDTSTGYPVSNGVHSVAVWCGDGMYGDGLSTLLFTLGVDDGMELYRSGRYDFEAVFVTDDGIFVTDRADEVFTLSE